LAAAHLEGEDLGELVAVQLADGGHHAVELPVQRLDEEHQLSVLADLPLPTVDRADAWQDIDAGGLAPHDDLARNQIGLLFGPDGGDDDDRPHRSEGSAGAARGQSETASPEGSLPDLGVEVVDDDLDLAGGAEDPYRHQLGLAVGDVERPGGRG